MNEDGGVEAQRRADGAEVLGVERQRPLDAQDDVGEDQRDERKR